MSNSLLVNLTWKLVIVMATSRVFNCSGFMTSHISLSVKLGLEYENGLLMSLRLFRLPKFRCLHSLIILIKHFSGRTRKLLWLIETTLPLQVMTGNASAAIVTLIQKEQRIPRMCHACDQFSCNLSKLRL